MGKAAVQPWTKSRLLNRFGFLVFLGLAACVFAWGLQYKLSLYDSPSAASHPIPQAKLLSKNELSGTTDSPLVIRSKTSTRVIYTVPATAFFVLLLAVIAMRRQVSSRREDRARDSWHLCRGMSPIFFVRPPPSLI